MNEKINALFSDQEFLAKLLDLETDAEVQAMLADNGVELTLEEIALVKAGIDSRLSNETGELGEDDLEQVVGGIAVTTIISLVVTGITVAGTVVDRLTRRRW